MLKLLSLSAVATVALAAAAFAADSSATPPAAKNGMFVNAKGMTLYTFDKDTPGKSVCNGQCATNWPPRLPQRSWRVTPYQRRQRASARAYQARTVLQLHQSVRGVPVVPLVCSTCMRRGSQSSARKA